MSLYHTGIPPLQSSSQGFSTTTHVIDASLARRPTRPPALHFPTNLDVSPPTPDASSQLELHAMTAPLHNPPRSSGIPPSQNTAPVAEFRCLFTTDIRRKSKRWQDGFLKYHTFNNRVMVYDNNRYFQGDAYWKESTPLQEGAELVLDKGYLVEVADAIGVTQTDLTPLLEKKKKSPEKDPAAAIQLPRAPVQRSGSQLKHKSLNALLGTPKGPIGKSVPIRSPYEQRQEKEREKENEWASERAAKRQKLDHAAQVSSPTAAPTPTVARAAPSLPKPLLFSKTFTAPRPAPRPSTVIEISSTPPEISSDTVSGLSDLGFSKPLQIPNQRPEKPQAPLQAPEPAPPKTAVQPPPAAPKRKIQLPRPKSVQAPQPRPQPSSPPVSASNRITNVDFVLSATKKPAREQSPPKSPPRDPKARALRLATGVKRRMLVCQQLSPPRSRIPSKYRSKTPEFRNPPTVPERTAAPASHRRSPAPEPKKPAKPVTKRKAAPPPPEPEPIVLSDDEGFRFEDDIFEIEPHPIVSKKRRTGTTSRKEVDQPRTINSRARAAQTQSSSPAFEDIDVVHGLLDLQMLPRPPPPTSRKQPAPAKQVASPPAPAPAKKPRAKKPTKKQIREAATNVASTIQVPSSPGAEESSEAIVNAPEKGIRGTKAAKPAADKPGRSKQRVSPSLSKQAEPQPEPESILIPDSPSASPDRSLPPSPITASGISPPQRSAPATTTAKLFAKAQIKTPLSTGGFRKKNKVRKTGDALKDPVPEIPIHCAPIFPPAPTSRPPTETDRTLEAEQSAERDGDVAAQRDAPDERNTPASATAPTTATSTASKDKNKRCIIIEGPRGSTSTRVLIDHIEDDVLSLSHTTKPHLSTSSFRCVKSVNDTDAPIPSMSGEWERRNTGRRMTSIPTISRKETNIPPGTAFPDPSPGTLSLLEGAVTEETDVAAHPSLPHSKDTVVPGRTKMKPPFSLAALINRTDPRRKFLRTTSRNAEAANASVSAGSARRGSVGSNSGMDNANPPSPVADTDIGPWSTEAFDLFDWKPPGIKK